MRVGLRKYGRLPWVCVVVFIGALLWSWSQLEAFSFSAPQVCEDRVELNRSDDKLLSSEGVAEKVMQSSAPSSSVSRQPSRNMNPVASPRMFKPDASSIAHFSLPLTPTASIPSHHRAAALKSNAASGASSARPSKPSPSHTTYLSLDSTTQHSYSPTRDCDFSRASLTSMWRTWQRCWTQGRWERLNDSMIEHRSLHRYYTSPVKMADMDNYTWVTHDIGECACFPFHDFNKTHFCEMIDGKDVLIIGDSKSGQLRESMINMAGERQPGELRASIPQRFPYRRPIYSDATICNVKRPARTHLFINYVQGHLKMLSELNYTSISKLCNPPRHAVCRNVDPKVVPGSEEDRILGIDELADWVNERDISLGIIVVNSGAHWQPDAVFIPQVRKALHWIVTAFPDALIVWRNTAVGHANCSSIRAPLATPQDWRTLPKRWDKFPGQNKLMEDMIEREFPTVMYLDVANMTQYRGDLHVSQFRTPPDDVDCLHYHGNAPNPLDHWVIALYNLLRAFHEWTATKMDKRTTPHQP